ncbi:hypothetical protein V1524DRAFT_472971 [Lipomyces starkeyi]
MTSVSLPPNLQRIDPQANAVPLQPFVLYHDDFLKVLGTKAEADRQRRNLLAHEGVWIPESREVFFTSNQFYGDAKHHHRVIRISKIKAARALTPQSPILTGNGATNFDDGVLFCQQGSTVRHCFYGRPFNAPNDVVVLPMDGSIWFTDPDYAQLQSLRRFRRLSNQVYCFSADNWNIAFLPDWKRCYITDTEAYDGLGNNVARAAATVYVQDVVEQKSPSCKRVFAFAYCGAPDGIKVDLAGNVYIGCVDSGHVRNPSGTLIGKILVPRGIADLCFADPGTIILLSEARIFEVKCAAQGTLVR